MFVESSFPRMVRMSEVYLSFQRPAQALVQGELLAIVHCEGLAFVLRDGLEHGCSPAEEIRSPFPGQGIRDKELCLPLRESGYVSLFSGSFDRIPFPISDTFFPVDDGGALIDEYAVGDAASFVLSRPSVTTLFPSVAKMGFEISPSPDPRIDRLVNCLRGDVPLRVVRVLQLQSAGDLRGGMIFLQPSLDFGHEFGVVPLGSASGSLSTFLGCTIRRAGQVESRCRVPRQLPVDARDVFP